MTFGSRIFVAIATLILASIVFLLLFTIRKPSQTDGIESENFPPVAEAPSAKNGSNAASGKGQDLAKSNKDKYEDCIKDVADYEAKKFADLPEPIRQLAGEYRVAQKFEVVPKNLEAIVMDLPKDIPVEGTPKLNNRYEGSNSVTIAFQEQDECLLREQCRILRAKPPTLIEFGYSQPAFIFEFPTDQLVSSDGHVDGSLETASKLKLKLKRFEPGLLYVEWINGSYDPKLDSSYLKNFIALLRFKAKDPELTYHSRSARDHCTKLYSSEN